MIIINTFREHHTVYTHRVLSQPKSWLQRLAPYRVELFFLLLALLPHLYIAFSNPNTILDWYSSDDGFYYFQVARNLAAGLGFTFDGLNPTNGFHPLWLFLVTPLFLLAQMDLLLPLRVLIVFSAFISAACAILVYRILRRFTSVWVAAFIGLLWVISPRIHDLTLHAGTEAGINALSLLWFWHALVSFPTDARRPADFRQLAALGAIGALAVLARLDNVFVVGLGGLWLWWRLWRATKKANAWAWRLQTGAAFAAPIAIAMLAYLAWNYFAFDTLTPVSGQVKLWWGTLRNTVYGFPVNSLADFAGQFFTDHAELGPWSLFTAPLYAAADGILMLFGQTITVAARRVALLGVGGTLATLSAVIVWTQRIFLREAAAKLALLPLFLGCFFQISYYKWAGSVAQQPWYWMAEMIFLLLTGGLLLEALLRLLAARVSKRTRGAVANLGVVALAALALSFFGFISTAVRALGDGSNHFYIHRARWLEANTEPGARIAITGGGNLAYFSNDRTIVNMDGLMNTIDYLHALQAGEGAQYLNSLGVDYIFGNEYILTETNPYEPMLAGRLEPYAVYTFADRELPLWRFVSSN